MPDYRELIRKWTESLNLRKHPEGGSYAEIYRSPGIISAGELKKSHFDKRCYMTSIYFMLEAGEVSKLHRLKSDEIWYFHAGSAVTIHQILPDQTYQALKLGSDLEAGQQFQHVVTAGTWFGATVDDREKPALVGCAVAPGFDFADFEMAERDALLKQFPQHRSLIEQLT